MQYSTKKVSKDLISEIVQALKNVRWGSVELFVQNDRVTQITERNIKKTDHSTKDLEQFPLDNNSEKR